MKSNFRKIINLAAILIFLAAIGINIKVTLDDPFEMVNEKALAQETTVIIPSCSSMCSSFDEVICHYYIEAANGDRMLISCPDYSPKTAGGTA
ncbi:hypothetical protein KO529_01425 [Arenibacter algicola]|uniref:hypothetical protein n=1 Tax=Arenibacter algicola TaxID=616991 RepID=UPI001C0689DD|nr:hypothetical protein [Arenibacter algicola]MBU2903429.1 hypothetical protein [Arenibacter algicola]